VWGKENFFQKVSFPHIVILLFYPNNKDRDIVNRALSGSVFNDKLGNTVETSRRQTLREKLKEPRTFLALAGNAIADHNNNVSAPKLKRGYLNVNVRENTDGHSLGAELKEPSFAVNVAWSSSAFIEF
jgi:hypothetical protein